MRRAAAFLVAVAALVTVRPAWAGVHEAVATDCGHRSPPSSYSADWESFRPHG
jgi:hypothetical protein